MSLVVFEAVVLASALGAGFVGAIAGLGGGVLLVPILTIGLGVDVRFAIGASIVSVIATSSGAAAAYVKDHLTNLRIGMFLEIATTSGAITGAVIA
ncbi:MAG: TSUP family transporter, partial [Chloroflexota bacterium]